jgi:hypothetical protein
MTKIKKYVEGISEELDDAKKYIEKALEYKAIGNGDRYNGYKAMSTQELEHAMRLHEYAVQDIEQLKAVYPEIPQKMMDAWEKSHVDFVEKTAWIKQMQAM